MIWVDVDTALASVPVNAMPLIDDSDFKTIEAAVAFNAAGLALFWNFVTTAGVMTQTAVTPTSGGSYDWTDLGTGGMYAIEIPASGGASINNDTEGFGWFTGVATGVLPWAGPIIGFRAAGLNDKLIDSAYDTTRGLAGTALPGAAAEAAGGLYTRGSGAGQINQQANGQIDANLERWINVAPLALASQRVVVDVGAISGDATAADNAETAFDGGSFNVGGGGVVAASVTGAVGSVTGNVGGNVNGNVVGSVGAIATGGITAASFAANAIEAAALAADALTAIGTAVWASATRTLTSFGTLAADVWAVATRTLTSLAGNAADIRAAVGLAAANLDTQLGSIQADTTQLLVDTTTILANQTTINGNVLTRATPAQVNAEVLDVLNVDTFGEPTGVPPATTTLVQKIGRLHMALRNGVEVDANTGEKKFLDDGGAAEWKKDFADAAGVYTEGEATTP